MLRLWVRGEGLRSIERLAVIDRKTVRRYVAAAVDVGLVRDGGEDQLNDVLMASVCEAVRPHRGDGHGEAWGLLVADHDRLKGWLVDDGLTVVKTCELLARHGMVVPEPTVHRYALEVLGVGRSAREITVRVADGETPTRRRDGSGTWPPGRRRSPAAAASSCDKAPGGLSMAMCWSPLVAN